MLGLEQRGWERMLPAMARCRVRPAFRRAQGVGMISVQQILMPLRIEDVGKRVIRAIKYSPTARGKRHRAGK